MQCENRFCIYWNRHQCILQSISLDQVGICQSCICITMKEDILKKERIRCLDGIGRRERKIK